MKLSTSNEDKQKEFKAFFPELEIINGPDIKEVLGTLDEVIIYKTLHSEPGVLVEDTVLVINDDVKVDIKWNVDLIQEGDSLEWITSIGYSDGEYIYVSRGNIKGIGTKSHGDKGFAFDPYFIPVPLETTLANDIDFSVAGLTLAELSKHNLKHFFSARINSLRNFKEENYIMKIPVSIIKEWTGKYQNEEK